MVSGLSIDLMTRKRVKIYGRMIAAALSRISEDEDKDKEEMHQESDTSAQGQVQLVVRIEQSLGKSSPWQLGQMLTERRQLS
jgi:hypothetical protein